MSEQHTSLPVYVVIENIYPHKNICILQPVDCQNKIPRHSIECLVVLLIAYIEFMLLLATVIATNRQFAFTSQLRTLYDLITESMVEKFIRVGSPLNSL